MAEPVVYSELDNRLRLDGQGDIKTVVNVEAIRNSIENILDTMQGQRVMLMEFASRMKSALFDPNQELLRFHLAREIKTVIERWDDRVIIEGVDFKNDPERGYAKILIRYVIVGSSEVFTLEKRVLQ